jgi:hypothetical protein
MIQAMLRAYRLYVVTYSEGFQEYGFVIKDMFGKKHGNFNVLSWVCGLVRRYENN